MHDIRFLSIQLCIKINKDQISEWGGLHGIRDYKLLEAAVLTPQSTFHGKYLYEDIFHMAAAYARGIIKNHPFIDGNKRTGLLIALIFLEFNNYEIKLTDKEFYDLALNIATSTMTISSIATFFRNKILKH